MGQKFSAHTRSGGNMKMMIAWLAITAALVAGQAYAQTAGAPLPQFQVDPFWPKLLPNNWILGQVSGIATDKYDRIWVVHRPGSLPPRERATEQTPPEAKCCIAAPPVLVFRPVRQPDPPLGRFRSGLRMAGERARHIHRRQRLRLARRQRQEGRTVAQ